MKKNLHLFGIGNAIMDIQVQVEHDAFEKLQLRKGGMALATQEEQDRLHHALERIPAVKSSGGSAANSIIAFAQLGGKAGYSGLLGDDEHGKLYADEFKELGIELNVHLHPNKTSGTSFIIITPDAERTMNTYLGVNGEYSPDHVDDGAVKRSEWVYLEGYKFTESSGADALDHAVKLAKASDTKIAVTFSDTFIVDVFGERLRNVVQYADLIFCNESEGMAFTRSADADSALTSLMQSIPSGVMTLGGKGAKAWINGTLTDIPAFATTPIDATGAGDAFAGGFLYGLTHGHSVLSAGTLGSLAASRVIAQVGPRLPHNDIQAVKKEILG
jgi:sugar/nucleoside kinase (ribokinase family)